jgi:hypothetical protein
MVLNVRDMQEKKAVFCGEGMGQGAVTAVLVAAL